MNKTSALVKERVVATEVVTDRIRVGDSTILGISDDINSIDRGYVAAARAVNKLYREISKEIITLTTKVDASTSNTSLISNNLVSATLDEITAYPDKGFDILKWVRFNDDNVSRTYIGTGIYEPNHIKYPKIAFTPGNYFTVINVNRLDGNSRLLVKENDSVLKTIYSTGVHVIQFNIKDNVIPTFSLEANQVKQNERISINKIGLYKSSDRLDQYLTIQLDKLIKRLGNTYITPAVLQTHTQEMTNYMSNMYAQKSSIEAIMNLIKDNATDEYTKLDARYLKIEDYINDKEHLLDDYVKIADFNTLQNVVANMNNRLNDLINANIDELDRRYAKLQHSHINYVTKLELEDVKKELLSLSALDLSDTNMFYYKSLIVKPDADKVIPSTYDSVMDVTNWSTDPIYAFDNSNHVSSSAEIIVQLPSMEGVEFQVRLNTDGTMVELYHRNKLQHMFNQGVTYAWLLLDIRNNDGNVTQNESFTWAAIDKLVRDAINQESIDRNNAIATAINNFSESVNVKFASIDEHLTKLDNDVTFLKSIPKAPRVITNDNVTYTNVVFPENALDGELLVVKGNGIYRWDKDSTDLVDYETCILKEGTTEDQLGRYLLVSPGWDMIFGELNKIYGTLAYELDKIKLEQHHLVLPEFSIERYISMKKITDIHIDNLTTYDVCLNIKMDMYTGDWNYTTFSGKCHDEILYVYATQQEVYNGISVASCPATATILKNPYA